jgi:hypothetical protein
MKGKAEAMTVLSKASSVNGPKRPMMTFQRYNVLLFLSAAPLREVSVLFRFLSMYTWIASAEVEDTVLTSKPRKYILIESG